MGKFVVTANKESTKDLFCPNRACPRYLRATPCFCSPKGVVRGGRRDWPKCYVCAHALVDVVERVAQI